MTNLKARESINKTSIEGLISEYNITIKTYLNNGLKNVSINGKLLIKVNDDIIEQKIQKVKYFNSGKKMFGTDGLLEAFGYKFDEENLSMIKNGRKLIPQGGGLITIMKNGKEVSKEKIKGDMENATRVLTNGTIDNDAKIKDVDGEEVLALYQQLKIDTISTRGVKGKDNATFRIEGAIKEISDIYNSKGEITGDLKLSMFTFNFFGLVPLNFIIPKEYEDEDGDVLNLAEAFMNPELKYKKGASCLLSGKIKSKIFGGKSEVREKTSKQTFGKKVEVNTTNKLDGYKIQEYFIVYGEGAYPKGSSKEYTIEVVKDSLEKHEMWKKEELLKKQAYRAEQAKKKNETESMSFKENTENLFDKEDDDLPF